MKDNMLLATVAGGTARVAVATTTQLVNEARLRHDTFPTATAALGRVLTAGLLLATNLKGEDTLTIRFLGDGPLGAVVVSADAWSTVRGYVQEPHTHLPAAQGGKLDVGGAVGKGMLYVSRDLGFGQPYTGGVEIVSGEIAEDIAHYLTVSEQTPSALSLGVLVGTDNSVLAAGGLLVQMMPGAEAETVATLEKNLDELGPISSLIGEGQDVQGILDHLTKGLPVMVHAEKPVRFACNCSKQRLEKILISLGTEELQGQIESEGKAEIICHFCSDKYDFNRAELEDLMEQILAQDEVEKE